MLKAYIRRESSRYWTKAKTYLKKNLQTYPKWISVSSKQLYTLLKRLNWRAHQNASNSFLEIRSQKYNEKLAIYLMNNKKYSLLPTMTSYTYVPIRSSVSLSWVRDFIDSKPSFSIIVPVYNTPASILQEAIQSVLEQDYEDWELFLINDASESVETLNVLTTLNDPRIHIIHLSQNLGIAGASNVGIEESNGDYIVFLDHDDELTNDCLYELAIAITSENSDFLYSDEDKISLNGNFCDPHYKPQWSPDTMMSTMYTGHVCCIKKSLIQQVGGLRSKYDGCQDWDLVLRITEITNKITHIPKVLYHWRVLPNSIAYDINAKPYVLQATQEVRQDALKRRNISGCIEKVSQVDGYFRVKYNLTQQPLISIIIPSKDNIKYLQPCINSILKKTDYKDFEIIVIDNNSSNKETLDYLDVLQKEVQCISIIQDRSPFNYSKINNLGVKHCKGNLILFLNDDTEVLQSDWLDRLGGFAQQSHIGAVGAKLLYPDRYTIQHSGIINLQNGPGHAFLKQHKDIAGYYMRNLLEYNWLAVTGACLMIERNKFEAIGGFSEDLPIAYNDVDLCMKLIDYGLFNVVCQSVSLIHHESISRGIDDLDPIKIERLKLERHRLYEKNPKYFQYDPFYSPNLHPNGINFEFNYS